MHLFKAIYVAFMYLQCRVFIFSEQIKVFKISWASIEVFFEYLYAEQGMYVNHQPDGLAMSVFTSVFDLKHCPCPFLTYIGPL